MFWIDKIKRHKEILLLMVKHGLGKVGIAIIIIAIVSAVFAPFLWTVDPMHSGEYENILLPPSLKFWLGTDDMGRDVWSQVIYGSRISLMIGLLAAVCSVTVGAVMGLVAGYFGGLLDELIMRIVDFFMMLPFLPMMIILAAILGPSIWNMIIVIMMLEWAWIARLVRSEVLSLKERPYVEASKCLGSTAVSLMFVEMLPNVVPMLVATAILMIIEGIYVEAVLSFLGLGDPTRMSWGQMLENSFASGVMADCMWWSLPPIICIVVLTVGFSFVGTSFSDVTTPGYKESKGA